MLPPENTAATTDTTAVPACTAGLQIVSIDPSAPNTLALSRFLRNIRAALLFTLRAASAGCGVPLSLFPKFACMLLAFSQEP